MTAGAINGVINELRIFMVNGLLNIASLLSHPSHPVPFPRHIS